MRGKGEGEEDFHADLKILCHFISHCGVPDTVPSWITHLNWCSGWPNVGQSLSHTCNGTPPYGPYKHPGCCKSNAWCPFCSGRAPAGIWRRSVLAPTPRKHKKSPAHPPSRPYISAATALPEGVAGASGPQGRHRWGSARPLPEWSFSTTATSPQWSSRSARGSPPARGSDQAWGWTLPGWWLAEPSGCCLWGQGHAVGAPSGSRSGRRWWSCSAGWRWPGWRGCWMCRPEESQGHCWTGPRLWAWGDSHSAGHSGPHPWRNDCEKTCWGSGPAGYSQQVKLFHWKSGCCCCSGPVAQGLASCQTP